MTYPAQAVSPDAGAQSVAEAIALELAARDLYDAAIEAGADDPLWHALREQHESYAQRLAGIAGLSASGADSGLVDELSGDFTGSAAVEAAAALENSLAAGHTDRLPAVTGNELASAIASIVTAEARQATVLALLAGETDPEVLYVNPTSEAGV